VVIDVIKEREIVDENGVRFWNPQGSFVLSDRCTDADVDEYYSVRLVIHLSLRTLQHLHVHLLNLTATRYPWRSTLAEVWRSNFNDGSDDYSARAALQRHSFRPLPISLFAVRPPLFAAYGSIHYFISHINLTTTPRHAPSCLDVPTRPVHRANTWAKCPPPVAGTIVSATTGNLTYDPSGAPFKFRAGLVAADIAPHGISPSSKVSSISQSILYTKIFAEASIIPLSLSLPPHFLCPRSHLDRHHLNIIQNDRSYTHADRFPPNIFLVSTPILFALPFLRGLSIYCLEQTPHVPLMLIRQLP